MTVRDPEILELLHEEPELLALADAVSATQRPRRARRYVTPVTAVTIAAAALLVLALVAPWESDRRNPVLDRALAAVGAGPVLHVAERIYSGERVHIASGRSSRIPTVSEVWYDGERALARLLARRGGQIVRDGLVSGEDAHEAGQFASGALTAAARYRVALERGDATIVREDVVRRRAVYWIRIAHEPDAFGQRFASEIAVDRVTYRPVRFRFLRDGKPTGYESELLVLEAVPRSEADFRAPPIDLSVTESSGGSSIVRPSTTPSVAAVSFRGARWLGPAFAGLPLRELELVDTAARRDARTARGTLLVARYGDELEPPEERRPRGVVVTQVHADDATRSIVTDGPAPPPPGFVDVHVGQTAGGGPVETCDARGCRREGGPAFPVDVWYGSLRAGGLWIEVRTTSRALLLQAARALRPIPLPR